MFKNIKLTQINQMRDDKKEIAPLIFLHINIYLCECFVNFCTYVIKSFGEYWLETREIVDNF